MEKVVFDLYNGQLLPWQDEVIADDHRFKVLVVGRKGRKTTLGINELAFGALSNPLTYIYLAPFRKQAKDIVWDDHIERLLRNFRNLGIPFRKNESELTIRIKGYGKIVIDGADNSDNLRGQSDWGGVFMDEYGDWKDDIFEPIILPNLSVHKAWAYFAGTPKGFNHFHKIAKLGDWRNIIEGELPPGMKKDKDFITFRFTSYENPRLPREEIDSAKRISSEEYFQQEYLAKFTHFTGRVYKEFDRNIHVISPFDIPNNWSFYRTLDFGFTNPTVCLWIAVDRDDNWFVFDEYFETEQPVDYHAGIINARHNQRYTATYGDPTAAQQISDYARRGLYISPANKEVNTKFPHWIRSGIEVITDKLRVLPTRKKPIPPFSTEETNSPALFIFNHCHNLIREFETYSWKKKKIGSPEEANEPDMPEKANDHGMDALRYFAVSYKHKPTTIEFPEMIYDPITGTPL